MTLVASTAPVGPTRVRIAIASPDILAQIRQVFASKNLAVDIVCMPYVEVAVRPAAEGTSLEQVVGPVSPSRAPVARRLCAEYRLNVVGVGVGDGPRAGHPVPEDQPRPAPDPGGPAAALSRRQHEVMALVSAGVRNAEIAARLRISEKTVKNHINRIFRSLGAGSRVEAVLVWQRRQPGDAIRRGASNPPPALVAGRQPENGGSP
jgi:DNA-binding CsgD family transcriptional regulator